jgi:HSP20 family protein
MHTLLPLNPSFNLVRSLFQSLSPAQTTDTAEAFTVAPAYYIGDTQEAHKIFLDLPGVDKKDLQISPNEDRLSIKATRKIPTGTGDTVLAYERSFWLPSGTSEADIQAKLEAGVLQLTVQKLAPPSQKYISVS